MNGTRLSEHFNEDEFRCEHCGKVLVSPRLLSLLESARVQLGRPIVISSGFRCPEHNKAVGGKPTSAHLTGEAVDIVCAFAGDRFDLIRTFLTLGATRIGIGFKGGFIHVDVSETLPQRVIWGYDE